MSFNLSMVNHSKVRLDIHVIKLPNLLSVTQTHPLQIPAPFTWIERLGHCYSACTG